MKDKNKKQLNKDLDEKNADQNNEKGALDSAEESLSESENNNTG